ncbi:hypothetical protein K402DRAFT_250163 [Aulographum hederae CBS 113979]|uniref:Uncharacterized protein n=1 Tax=Aulographum hederae CBS 113979 TaxID=1176131 RepID=A0A6G1GJT4_9PEZI|nr:hypothetical protein K402DRAFT_250163 [Aulographum hederae CBS 113979]
MLLPALRQKLCKSTRSTQPFEAKTLGSRGCHTRIWNSVDHGRWAGALQPQACCGRPREPNPREGGCIFIVLCKTLAESAFLRRRSLETSACRRRRSASVCGCSLNDLTCRGGVGRVEAAVFAYLNRSISQDPGEDPGLLLNSITAHIAFPQ